VRASNRSGVVRLVVACLMPVPGMLAAQVDSTAAARAATPHITRRKTCFRARPIATCRAWIPFTITTVVRLGHASHAVDSPFGYAPGDQIDFRDFGAVDVGYMLNRDSSDAIGALIEAGTGGLDKRFALKAKGQHWLSPSWTVSASGGLLSAQQQAVAADHTTRAYGATGDIAVDFEDQMGVVVSGDVTRQATHQATALRVGVRGGSYTALWEAAFFAFIDIAIISPLVHGHSSDVGRFP